MKKDDDSITVTQSAKVLEELSPNMKAKLHKWMALGLLHPTYHAPPRQNDKSLLNRANVVHAVILHWLFSCGVRFKNVTGGVGVGFSYYPDDVLTSFFVPAVFPSWESVVEHYSFDFIVVTYPQVGKEVVIGPQSRKVASFTVPGRKPSEPFYHIFSVLSKSIDKFRAEYAPEWRTVPRIEMEVKPIYEQICARWPR